MTAVLAETIPLRPSNWSEHCAPPDRRLCLQRACKLKLDREFVRALPDHGRAYSVVKMITALGRELGMTVVAEDVETAAQRDCLCAAGVDALQGWRMAMPMPDTELFNWLDGTSK